MKINNLPIMYKAIYLWIIVCLFQIFGNYLIPSANLGIALVLILIFSLLLQAIVLLKIFVFSSVKATKMLKDKIGDF